MTGAVDPIRGREAAKWVERVLLALPYMSFIGCAMLVVNVAASFEEPHTPMLVASGLLVLAAPVGMLLHLSVTSELSLHEKRLWLAELKRGNARLFGSYFSRAERRAATRSLVVPR